MSALSGAGAAPNRGDAESISTPQLSDSAGTRSDIGPQRRSKLTLTEMRRWERALLAGRALLMLQFVGLGLWSEFQYRRFALSWDFSIYHQAWYLIAHGHLNPFVTTMGIPFWRNHSEFFFWALAPLYWVWPHGVTLLWVQDLGVVGAEWVIWTWMFELCSTVQAPWTRRLTLSAGMLLLVADPWIFWSVSFDFHFETAAVVLACLAARDLFRGRWRAMLWALLLLGSGVVAGTYLVGIGFGGLLAVKGRSRWIGALFIGGAVVVAGVVTAVHGNAGADITQTYGYLAVGAGTGGAGALLRTHDLTVTRLFERVVGSPGTIVRVLWSKALDIWANIAGSGILGPLWLPVLPLIVFVVLETGLFPSLHLVQPSFQSLPVYLFGALGTIGVLTWLARRRNRLTMVTAGVIAAEVLAWAAVWLPYIPSQTVRVSSEASSVLRRLERRIPIGAEVIASQGIGGRFAARPVAYSILGSGSYPVRRRLVWVVLTPRSGIETETVSSAEGLEAELAHMPGASLVVDRAGVVAFRWRVQSSVHRLRVPLSTRTVPAVFACGAAGTPVTSGRPSSWYVAGRSVPGYVVDQAEWRLAGGAYDADVRLASTGPVAVEVWNDTGDALLARRWLAASNGYQTIRLPFTAAHQYRPTPRFSGIGPLSAQLYTRAVPNRFEVRVWSSGHWSVSVQSVSIRRV